MLASFKAKQAKDTEKMGVLRLTISLLCTGLLTSSQADIQSPIVFFPGVTNSVLEVTNNDGGFCNTGTTAQRIWIEPFRLFLCGGQELGLSFDPVTRSSNNNPGVSISVAGFGGTEDVEYMGLSQTLPYLKTFVDYFVERGYKRGKSIRTAPYDWRFSAAGLEDRGYFKDVQELIEDTYQKNGYRRVTLVAHSMGGLVSHHFLTHTVNQTWKDKYIHAYVPLSGAWSGGVQTLARLIYGQDFKDNDLLSYLINGYLVPIIRTLPSLLWLSPRESVYKNAILISTPQQNYTAADYFDLFERIGDTNAFQIFNDLITFVTPNFPPPNVPTFCYYGYNVSTPETYIFEKEFDPLNSIGVQPSDILYGNGDGTVNQVSSAVCHQWKEMTQSFTLRQYEGVNHGQMITNERVLNDVALIVGASPPASMLSDE